MLFEERGKSEKRLKKCADVDHKIYGIVSMKFWTWHESNNSSLRKKAHKSYTRNKIDTIVKFWVGGAGVQEKEYDTHSEAERFEGEQGKEVRGEG